MRGLVGLTFLLALLELGYTFPNVNLLSRLTGYFEEFSEPSPYEIRNWFSRISVISEKANGFFESGFLNRKEYRERKNSLKLAFGLIVVERMTWYHPNETTRRSAEKAIADCAEIFSKSHQAYCNSQNTSLKMIQVHQMTTLQKEKTFHLRTQLEIIRLSLLHSFYDTKWRAKCTVLADSYIKIQSKLHLQLYNIHLPECYDFIRLEAMLQTIVGLSNCLRKEGSEDPKEKFQEAILLGMEFAALKILNNLESTDFTAYDTHPKNINALVEDSEHLAAKFLFLEFPMGPLLKTVAVEIQFVFIKLRKIGFYDLSNPKTEHTNGNHQEIKLPQKKLQLEFAKRTMARLTILLLRSIEQALKDVPEFRRIRVLNKWKANSQSLIGEYEAWGLKDSSYSQVVYQLHGKICSLKWPVKNKI